MTVHELGQLNFPTNIYIFFVDQAGHLLSKKSFKWWENSNGQVISLLVNVIEDQSKMRIPSEINPPLNGHSFGPHSKEAYASCLRRSPRSLFLAHPFQNC